MADYPNFPTLSINPVFPVDYDREDSTIGSPFEGGYEQTRSRFTRTRHKFKIRYDNLTDADAALLDSFIDTVKGRTGAFNWTHPKTSVVYLMRFEKPLPVIKWVSAGCWDTEFMLVEV